MKTVIIREDSEFEKLEKDWNTALANSGIENIFLTFEWLFTWWQHFKNRYLLFIILVFEGERIVGIAPLMIAKKYGFRQLRFISDPHADYEDVITVGNEEKREAIIKAIIDKLSISNGWDMFCLKGIRNSSPNFSSFARISSRGLPRRVSFRSHRDPAPYLLTTGEWEKFCSGLNKKLLSDTKRQLSRLEKQGKIFFSDKIADKKDILPLLDMVIEFYSERHRLQGHKSIFEDGQTRDFLKAIAGILYDRGWLELRYMQIGNSIAALHFGFRFAGKFYYYIPTFSDRFKQYSVGRILLFDLIRECFSDGITQFDFMAGDEDYKNSWNPRLEPLYFINIYPRTIPGYLAYLSFSRLIMAVKKILNKKW